jgi:hypothetical protein
MQIETYDVWPYQDWRTLARRTGWGIIVAAASRRYHVPLPTILFTLTVDMLVLSIFSFGILTPVLIFAAEGTLDLLLSADATVYAFADWIIRRTVGETHVFSGFLAAFGAEILLAFGALHSWNAAHMGPRLLLWLLRTIQ